MMPGAALRRPPPAMRAGPGAPLLSCPSGLDGARRVLWPLPDAVSAIAALWSWFPFRSALWCTSGSAAALKITAYQLLTHWLSLVISRAAVVSTRTSHA